MKRNLKGLIKLSNTAPFLTRSDMRQIRKAFSEVMDEWKEVGSFADWDRRKEMIGPKAIVDYANRILTPKQIANYKNPNPLYRNGVALTDEELTRAKAIASNYLTTKKPQRLAKTTSK